MERTRSYSIGNEQDNIHTMNGRCPNYALSWINNKHYWPRGHDYFLGNNTNINDGTQELREILSKRLSNEIMTNYIVFCDLDGVLADFEQGVKNKFKKSPDELKPGLMWALINKSNTFFETLPWMPQGQELWSQIKQYNPIILTGVPNNNSKIIEQKLNWVHRELGPDIDVITCATKDKPKYCIPQAILIDDRPDNMKAWNQKDGKFLLYTEDNLEQIIERIHRHMHNIDLPSP